MTSGDLSGLIGGLGSIIVCGFIVKVALGYAWKSKSLKARKEMQTLLVNKFSSASEMTQFLETSSGKKFVENLSQSPVSVHDKILSSVSNGIILFLLGIGVVLFGGLLPDGVQKATRFCGLIGSTIGLGFIISSFVSYRLSKAWGLFTRPSTES